MFEAPTMNPAPLQPCTCGSTDVREYVVNTDDTHELGVVTDAICEPCLPVAFIAAIMLGFNPSVDFTNAVGGVVDNPEVGE